MRLLVIFVSSRFFFSNFIFYWDYTSPILSDLLSSVDYSDFNAQIANKESNIGVMKHYSSKSHIALAYMALTDLVMYGKRNLSICQNCGRYYLQYSGKEVYCDLPNQDGSLDKLLAEANRQLGELNAYSILIPNVDKY